MSPLQDMLDATYLTGVHEGSRLSDLPARAATATFELSDGTVIDQKRWYSRRAPDMHLDYMTQLSEHVGLLWGVSTGESGKKYQVDPSFRIGFLVMAQPRPGLILSLSISQTLGGLLREKPCTADYGDIGGVMKVNCRFAASTLEPAETLRYLWKNRPTDHTRIGGRLTFVF